MKNLNTFSVLAAWFWALSLSADPCSKMAQRLLRQGLPALTPLQYAGLLLREDHKFPKGLFPVPWGDIFNDNTVKRQRELMDELGRLPEFHSSLENRRELLTLKVIDSEKGRRVKRQIVDEDFLKDWGLKLHEDLVRQQLQDSKSILQKITEILELPAAQVTSASLAQNLAATIEGLTPQLRVAIADEVAEGKITTLAGLLPEDLSSSGFNPLRLGLKVGESRDYYLNLLAESLEIGRKLDLLLPAYLLLRYAPANTYFGNYFNNIGERHLATIKNVRFKRRSIGEILNASHKPQRKLLKKLLEGRIARIAKDLSGHKKTVVEQVEGQAHFTLTEVHPYLAIFRGQIGGDCATKHCFAFANSPMERVFFIANKKGESVGYVSTTMVSLKDKSPALFVNTIAGARVSGTMAEKILLGLERAKKELGVQNIVLLGKEKTHETITHPVIKHAYNQLRGKPVKIIFSDHEIRKIVAKKVVSTKYDMPDVLENANKLELPESSINVQVEKRAFSGEIPALQDLAPLDAINAETALVLFRFLLKNKGPDREFETILPQLPARLNSHTASEIFHQALLSETDSKYITPLLERLPENLDSKSAAEMFCRALLFQSDSPYAKKILEHLPDQLHGPAASKMFRFALIYAPRWIDKIMLHLPQTLDDRQAFKIFASALEYRLAPPYLDAILAKFPKPLSDFYADELFTVILQSGADTKYLENIVEGLPDTLDITDASKMLETAFQYGADAKYTMPILDRLPEQAGQDTLLTLLLRALKHKAQVQLVENLLGRLPAGIDSSFAPQIFEQVLIYRLGPEYLDAMTKHLSEKSAETLGHFYAKIKRLPDSDYKKQLLEWITSNFYPIKK